MTVFYTQEKDSGERLDKVLSERFSSSRAYAQKLIEDGFVFLDSRPAKKNDRLRSGQEIAVEEREPEESGLVAQQIPLNIVYEDDYIIVVDKPKNMVVHPGAGNPDGTLANALLYHCAGNLSGINGVIRPGIVHRIDKDTSGLLVAAKTDDAHNGLAAQIKEHSFLREYEAIVYGRLENSGTVDAPIARDPRSRVKMVVVNGGKRAVTHYEPVEVFAKFTHVRCRLQTGRTHQIRVHMAYINHPVLGDPLYAVGRREPFSVFGGQCLHAAKLGIMHPITGEYMEFSSDLPEYFIGLLTKAKNEL